MFPNNHRNPFFFAYPDAAWVAAKLLLLWFHRGLLQLVPATEVEELVSKYGSDLME